MKGVTKLLLSLGVTDQCSDQRRRMGCLGNQNGLDYSAFYRLPMSAAWIESVQAAICAIAHESESYHANSEH